MNAHNDLLCTAVEEHSRPVQSVGCAHMSGTQGKVVGIHQRGREGPTGNAVSVRDIHNTSPHYYRCDSNLAMTFDEYKWHSCTLSNRTMSQDVYTHRDHNYNHDAPTGCCKVTFGNPPYRAYTFPNSNNGPNSNNEYNIPSSPLLYILFRRYVGTSGAYMEWVFSV